jgi:hypothetical protein
MWDPAVQGQAYNYTIAALRKRWHNLPVAQPAAVLQEPESTIRRSVVAGHTGHTAHSRGSRAHDPQKGDGFKSSDRG